MMNSMFRAFLRDKSKMGLLGLLIASLGFSLYTVSKEKQSYKVSLYSSTALPTVTIDKADLKANSDLNSAQCQTIERAAMVYNKSIKDFGNGVLAAHGIGQQRNDGLQEYVLLANDSYNRGHKQLFGNEFRYLPLLQCKERIEFRTKKLNAYVRKLERMNISDQYNLGSLISTNIRSLEDLRKSIILADIKENSYMRELHTQASKETSIFKMLSPMFSVVGKIF